MRLDGPHSYDAVLLTLRDAFVDHGWSAQIEPHDFSLHTMAADNTHCILFYAKPAPHAADAAFVDWAVADILAVSADDCGAVTDS